MNSLITPASQSVSVDSLIRGRAWTPVEDFCWLDCERPGLRKTWHHSEIVLCREHAEVLESGRYGQSYTGAPLPADSQAVSWPWCRIHEQLVVA